MISLLIWCNVLYCTWLFFNSSMHYMATVQYSYINVIENTYSMYSHQFLWYIIWNAIIHKQYWYLIICFTRCFIVSSTTTLHCESLGGTVFFMNMNLNIMEEGELYKRVISGNVNSTNNNMTIVHFKGWCMCIFVKWFVRLFICLNYYFVQQTMLSGVLDYGVCCIFVMWIISITWSFWCICTKEVY